MHMYVYIYIYIYIYARMVYTRGCFVAAFKFVNEHLSPKGIKHTHTMNHCTHSDDKRSRLREGKHAQDSMHIRGSSVVVAG